MQSKSHKRKWATPRKTTHRHQQQKLPRQWTRTPLTTTRCKRKWSDPMRSWDDRTKRSATDRRRLEDDGQSDPRGDTCIPVLFLDQVMRVLSKCENENRVGRCVFENVLSVAMGWSNRNAVDAVMQVVLPSRQQHTVVPPLFSKPHALQLLTVVVQFFATERCRNRRHELGPRVALP